MYVCISADRTAHPHTLHEMGMTTGSTAIVTLSEFTYRQGTEICGEKEPAQYVYQVKKGAVRSYKLLSDGRRQIAAFHLVGDIFGPVNGESHRFTSEAIVETTVRLVKRQSLDTAANGDADVTRNLLVMTANKLEHAENHMLLLGRKNSLERVAAFLIEMDGRLAATGVMTLPMTRRDIADYLGLTVETVSRALSQMRRAGVLNFLSKNQRDIAILDRQRLAMFDV
jgi:CRP/FNR family nitrogen fixation transcriptional regulator